jgi:hypothetical protein
MKCFRQGFPAIIIMTLITFGCNNEKKPGDKTETSAITVCSDDCKAQSKTGELSCKLTSPELQPRKATVLESLRKQVKEKKELKAGYAFKFPGTDKMLDELTEFIKTERECCDFFTFNLSVSGDKSEIWLELTGMEGAKDFIKTELEL